MHVKVPALALVLAVALLPALLALPSWPLTLALAGSWLGWLGIGLLASSLLSMVREPVWASAFGGLDRMYLWHHWLGVLGYAAVLAHPLLSLAPSRREDIPAAWSRLMSFSQTWPGELGWAALLGLMLGLASTFAVRLRYSLWRPLHALLGAAVGFGVAHIVAVGGQRWSWLVAVPVALALGWRALRADRGLGARPYEVNAVTHVSSELTEVTLRALATPAVAKPGQFVMAAFFEGPHFHGCGEYHPYSVSGGQANGTLVLSIKALGDCTRNIQALEPGVAVRVQGPYGSFLADRPTTPELWIAGGIGITPFLSQLRAAPLTRSTVLIYVHRDPRDVPYLAELKRYAAEQSQLHFHDLQLGSELAPLLSLLESLPDLTAHHAYLCGPPPLVDAVRGRLAQRGVPPAHIHFERFDFR
ncbi:MAG: hypothetical protein RL685_936 [Pseudomonadota bacterium]